MGPQMTWEKMFESIVMTLKHMTLLNLFLLSQESQKFSFLFYLNNFYKALVNILQF